MHKHLENNVRVVIVRRDDKLDEFGYGLVVQVLWRFLAGSTVYRKTYTYTDVNDEYDRRELRQGHAK